MNEADARDALLLRAYESTRDQDESRWSQADREWANQAAHAVEGEAASDEAFIARRARLGVERIRQRDRAATRVLRLFTWRPWIGYCLAPLAFLLGLATDVIGPTQKVGLLAPHLLALLGWNLAVYLFAGVIIFLRASERYPQAPRPFSTMLARASHGLISERRLARLNGPLRQFAQAWIEVSAPLWQARCATILHGCAALLALGMVSGMYVRGLVFEYRAGWESTFLQASQVHALLSLILGPAAKLTGIPMPDVASLQAMRLPASSGGDAAPWIHLYAVTVLLFVVLPRSLMAAWQEWHANRLSARVALPLNDPYFASLARIHSGRMMRLRVLPFGYRPGDQHVAGLSRLLSACFGSHTAIEIAPTIEPGNEQAAIAREGSDPDMSAQTQGSTEKQPDAWIVLLNLSATPEQEIHGAFLEMLTMSLPGTAPIAVLIDESSFRERFDALGQSGATRIQERRTAWTRLLSASGQQAAIAWLASPQVQADEAAQRALIQALEQGTEPVNTQQASPSSGESIQERTAHRPLT